MTEAQRNAYDDYRMSKQAISITLTPDNLVWLKGRARAEGLRSLSECLDRLVTRARFGRDTARPARSMKGVLAALAEELPHLGPAVPAEAWQTNWDGLLAGLDLAEGALTRGSPARTPYPQRTCASASRTAAPRRGRRE